MLVVCVIAYIAYEVMLLSAVIWMQDRKPLSTISFSFYILIIHNCKIDGLVDFRNILHDFLQLKDELQCGYWVHQGASLQAFQY